MNLITVRSNAIHAIGYDPQRMLLEIVFTSGGIYRYAHVPQQVAHRFVNAPSKGAFFQEFIRGHYQSNRVSRNRVRTRTARVKKNEKVEVNPVTEQRTIVGRNGRPIPPVS